MRLPHSYDIASRLRLARVLLKLETYNDPTEGEYSTTRNDP